VRCGHDLGHLGAAALPPGNEKRFRVNVLESDPPHHLLGDRQRFGRACRAAQTVRGNPHQLLKQEMGLTIL
jgi:hypothetical protein